MYICGNCSLYSFFSSLILSLHMVRKRMISYYRLACFNCPSVGLYTNHSSSSLMCIMNVTIVTAGTTDGSTFEFRLRGHSEGRTHQSRKGRLRTKHRSRSIRDLVWRGFSPCAIALERGTDDILHQRREPSF